MIPLRRGLLRGISSRILINLWTLVMFRTAEWCVVRTAPRYLLAFHVHTPTLTKMWGLCRARGGGPATCHDLSCFPLGGWEQTPKPSLA